MNFWTAYWLPLTKKRDGIASVPFFSINNYQLQELSHEKLVDLFRAADQLAVHDQNGNRLGARERDQFLLIVGILPNIFLNDFLAAMEISHAIQHALRKTAFVVEIKFQRHD
jgi:hypothetical protein